MKLVDWTEVKKVVMMAELLAGQKVEMWAGKKVVRKAE